VNDFKRGFLQALSGLVVLGSLIALVGLWLERCP
jgi:hypothetical protein